MPPEFLAKNHISEPPPKTSPAPTPRHISIPCERNQSTKLRCAAGCSLGWRGLRRSGRGLCLLAGRHPGAAWRRRLETSGASSRRLLLLEAAPSSSLLLLSDTDYFLSAVSKWSWEGGDCGLQLKFGCRHNSSSSSAASVELLVEARALCVQSDASVCISRATKLRPERRCISVCNSHNLAFISLPDLSTHLSMIEWDHPSPFLPPHPLNVHLLNPVLSNLPPWGARWPQCHTFTQGKLFPGLSAQSEPVWVNWNSNYPTFARQKQLNIQLCRHCEKIGWKSRLQLS